MTGTGRDREGSWTYVLGDIHGCYETLQRLFDRLDFEPDRDRLWLAGDLVNRGPSSVAVLRWARKLEKSLGDRFAAVLGNHDLRLLAFAEGVHEAGKRDTLAEVLETPDGGDLVRWLGRLPLLHSGDGVLMVHAGLLPGWSAAEAEREARSTEKALRGPAARSLLIRRPPNAGSVDPEIAARRRALEAFTRLRTCTADGEFCDYNGAPGGSPEGCLPWFEIPDRQNADTLVVCGHWAALGLFLGDKVIALDTGCVWGGALTAVRLEDRRIFRQELAESGWAPDL